MWDYIVLNAKSHFFYSLKAAVEIDSYIFLGCTRNVLCRTRMASDWNRRSIPAKDLFESMAISLAHRSVDNRVDDGIDIRQRACRIAQTNEDVRMKKQTLLNSRQHFDERKNFKWSQAQKKYDSIYDQHPGNLIAHARIDFGNSFWVVLEATHWLVQSPNNQYIHCSVDRKSEKKWYRLHSFSVYL